MKDYNGPRESAGIVDHALQLLEAAGVPIVIPQLTSQKSLENTCGDGSGNNEGSDNKICVLLFLPHIYDSSAKYRQNYLDTASNLAKKFRGTPFTFLWVEGGAQENLENKLNINNIYPSLAVISMDKKVYAVQKLSWSEKNSNAFLNGVIAGRYIKLIYRSIVLLNKMT